MTVSVGPVAAAAGLKDRLDYFAASRAFELAAAGTLLTDAFRRRALRGGGGSKRSEKPGGI